MHLDMNKDLLRINNYMQVLLITPKPPVSILKVHIITSLCGPVFARKNGSHFPKLSFDIGIVY